MREFTVQEIGVAKTPLMHRRDAPCQPQIQADASASGTVEVHEGFAPGLKDLEGFDRVWLLYIFDRNEGYRLTVQPPRGPKQKRGLFATRAPHRPSPIGLTCARLIKIEGNVLHLTELDLLNGTPIVDIKPYLPPVDAFFNVRTGWVGELDGGEDGE
jgi:tRNA-Thr(GGU) m(6)t(6)A37 methyltransferase TsaA